MTAAIAANTPSGAKRMTKSVNRSMTGTNSSIEAARVRATVVFRLLSAKPKG